MGVIDVIDGKVITPSAGERRDKRAGDYQRSIKTPTTKPFGLSRKKACFAA